ncbi:anthranilate synthase component I family protein [Parvicella tangerina]|uniref:Anthranilate synthase component 1 n=1 Tax=Parvicella tangerina TaxID=2829795 RepID=A0A916JQ24_9FLAO|nr:anthranilate synthase component I family protein [Parvicella tangerina]CAG5083902.1 Anthranilate synthase component 1 [Parvicella tangerina]
MTIKLQTSIHQSLSDLHTPVELYLKIRDRYPGAILLESSDYKSKENSFSYIAFNPIARFTASLYQAEIELPQGKSEKINLSEESVSSALAKFRKYFEVEENGCDFKTAGLFGYIQYDAIPLFQPITFKQKDQNIPLVHYQFFQNIIVFNHFNNELFVIEHLHESATSITTDVFSLLQQRTLSTFPFEQVDTEKSNHDDQEFLDKIQQAQEHCHRGDVFQLVLSRKFSQAYKGDDFNVYRALRSINPSPYLFYFDYGSYHIFGSSPEAQVIVQNEQAEIHPIAGTFKRTGEADKDLLLAKELAADPKENAEHNMLVDLARNDLSRFSNKVEVTQLKGIEFYSHVIHLVSKVTAKLDQEHNSIEILGTTYPAGTLSGAPKHKAMELIDKYEPDSRGFYGGAVGFIGMDGTVNHAIFIRSFLSQNNRLHYQAGCGVVTQSNPESELQEVNDKLNALRNAILLAQTL